MLPVLLVWLSLRCFKREVTNVRLNAWGVEVKSQSVREVVEEGKKL